MNARFLKADQTKTHGWGRQVGIVLTAAVLAVAGIGSVAMGQTTAPAVGAAAEPVAVQPFVGKVTSDRVYVRSGPSANYYEIGQLSKGDLVQVMGGRMGWYQIVPPTGTYCYIAKDLVEVDGAGTSGTVKGEFVNVRGASALHPASDYAVLSVVKKGTKLEILGATEKYYKIVPPEKAYIYISPQFVQAAGEGVAYVPANLRLPAGVVNPAATRPAPVPTVTTQPVTPVPATREAVVTLLPPTVATTQETTATQPAVIPVPATQGVVAVAPETRPAVVEPTTRVVAVAPQPAPYNEDAYARFSAVNAKTQAEFNKPILQQELGGLLEEYKALLKMPQLPSSVKQGSEARVAVVEKQMALQAIAKRNDPNAQTAFEEQRRVFQQQWQEVKQKLDEYEMSGPPLATGRLQTSTAVSGKYVLVDPATKRVVAYVEPSADFDMSRMLGQYIAVRGMVDKADNANIRVIKVSNVTLMKEPTVAGATTQP